jgi:hypothetical protein
LEASDQGHIRARVSRGRRRPGDLLGQSLQTSGYYQIKWDGERIRAMVHRLVAEAFHGPPPDHEAVCSHRNDIPHDNRAENLHWSTAIENIGIAGKNGRRNFVSDYLVVILVSLGLTAEETADVIGYKSAGSVRKIIREATGVSVSQVNLYYRWVTQHLTEQMYRQVDQEQPVRDQDWLDRRLIEYKNYAQHWSAHHEPYRTPSNWWSCALSYYAGAYELAYTADGEVYVRPEVDPDDACSGDRCALSPCLPIYESSSGHRYVRLPVEGFSLLLGVGVLVLRSVKGPPSGPGQVCRHLDGNPRNNHPLNLAWGTPEQNMKDKARHGRDGRKVSVDDAWCALEERLSTREFMERHGIAKSTATRYFRKARDEDPVRYESLTNEGRRGREGRVYNFGRRDVVDRLEAGASARSIAEEFEVSEHVIWGMRRKAIREGRYAPR